MHVPLFRSMLKREDSWKILHLIIGLWVRCDKTDSNVCNSQPTACFCRGFSSFLSYMARVNSSSGDENEQNASGFYSDDPSIIAHLFLCPFFCHQFLPQWVHLVVAGSISNAVSMTSFKLLIKYSRFPVEACAIAVYCSWCLVPQNSVRLDQA